MYFNKLAKIRTIGIVFNGAIYSVRQVENHRAHITIKFGLPKLS